MAAAVAPPARRLMRREELDVLAPNTDGQQEEGDETGERGYHVTQLQFGADVNFIPTAYHMTLPADEFYEATRIRDLGDGYSEYLSRSISQTCRLLREFVERCQAGRHG